MLLEKYSHRPNMNTLKYILIYLPSLIGHLDFNLCSFLRNTALEYKATFIHTQPHSYSPQTSSHYNKKKSVSQAE